MARSDRTKGRPMLEQWGAHELMTLGEAAAVAFPDGLLTEKTLRTAVRDGALGVVVIAGKHFTTRSALEAMCVARTLPQASSTGGPSKS